MSPMGTKLPLGENQRARPVLPSATVTQQLWPFEHKRESDGNAFPGHAGSNHVQVLWEYNIALSFSESSPGTLLHFANPGLFLKEGKCRHLNKPDAFLLWFLFIYLALQLPAQLL